MSLSQVSDPAPTYGGCLRPARRLTQASSAGRRFRPLRVCIVDEVRTVKAMSLQDCKLSHVFAKAIYRLFSETKHSLVGHNRRTVKGHNSSVDSVAYPFWRHDFIAQPSSVRVRGT